MIKLVPLGIIFAYQIFFKDMSKKIFPYSASKVRKEVIIKFLHSKYFAIILLIIAVISLFFFPVISFTFQAREESICKSDSERIYKEISSEWEDISSRAHSTSKISLAPVIGELQTVRRKFDKSEMPKCANFAKFITLKGMDSEIKSLLKFMAGQSETISPDIANKIVAAREKADIIANGKSTYKFNSEVEMNHKYGELYMAESTILVNKTMKEINELINTIIGVSQ